MVQENNLPPDEVGLDPASTETPGIITFHNPHTTETLVVMGGDDGPDSPPLVTVNGEVVLRGDPDSVPLQVLKETLAPYGVIVVDPDDPGQQAAARARAAELQRVVAERDALVSAVERLRDKYDSPGHGADNEKDRSIIARALDAYLGVLSGDL